MGIGFENAPVRAKSRNYQHLVENQCMHFHINQAVVGL